MYETKTINYDIIEKLLDLKNELLDKTENFLHEV